MDTESWKTQASQGKFTLPMRGVRQDGGGIAIHINMEGEVLQDEGKFTGEVSMFGKRH